MSAMVIDQRLWGIPRPLGEQFVEVDDRIVQKGIKVRCRLLRLGIGLLAVALLLTVVWVEPVISHLVA